MRSQPACLDMRFASGERRALPYSYITVMSFDAGTGIEIMTSSIKVKISGRQLDRLYDHLTMFRVKYVQENLGADFGEAGLFVKSIIVEEV